MAVVNAETLMKLLGDLPEEPLDGAYRVGATVLVKKLQVHAVRELRGKRNRDASQFATTVLRSPIGEAVLGFTLAAALEFLPVSAGAHVRQKLAYNLRVRSWEDLGEKLLPFVGLVIEDVEDVLKNLPEGGDKRAAA